MYKVDIWIKENEWKTFFINSNDKRKAIDQALNKIKDEYIIDIIASKVENRYYTIPMQNGKSFIKKMLKEKF